MPRKPRIKLESVHFNFDKGQVRFYPPHKKEAGFYGIYRINLFTPEITFRGKVARYEGFNKASAAARLLTALRETGK